MFKELNIVRPFMKEPSREFNVREIARIQHIAPATASTYLKTLKKERLLMHRKERMLDLYKADLESDAYLDLKTYTTIREIRESGMIDSLNKHYLKPTIILYGSAAKGKDTENSDIDLVIISENRKDWPERKTYENKLKKPIQLFIVKDLKDLRNEHLITNVLNGIVLQGELQWT